MKFILIHYSKLYNKFNIQDYIQRSVSIISSGDFITASGVILSRKQYGENSLWAKLFLKEYGIISASAPSQSSKHGFGGDIEPFGWGVFYLKRKSKSRNYMIYDIEINDTMFNLRKSFLAIKTAFKWSNKILKYLLPEQPDDDLLTNLYWSMKLLCEEKFPCDAADWRFIWRWLEIWGLAPDILQFCRARRFNRDEVLLLAKIAKVNTKNAVKIFSEDNVSNVSLDVRKNAFQYAADSAYKFLNEK